MKVILKENIKGVGRKYEIKEISDGYANNFLIPKKLVEFASPEAIKKAEILKLTVDAEKEVQEKLAEKQLEMLKEIAVTLKKKANEKGHLFEQVHLTEVSNALKEQTKIEIEEKYLSIEKPIKEVGEHLVLAEVGKNKGRFTLVVEAQK
ncbi:MAG: 50S ribosomal protein L9 [Candidatus Zambryskibacteria bacterium CG10_big_fil_rev_8_21_14_0_10_34_34]|uniref:Large ribosomal subunit protein bL9 n=1 Tax=Candidatus Zambryskibacteria bacterium CG10_big_fil_rev_8_21_14_0_10_34_34 TaxID=1975114 RepID=A0A2H0R0X3_9BACT|nr:MAG: 50S ribosomal protein L9 [Candidatus Zambryskibacteria bacterium CG10_big_fil_rev_8_21_14_0_10_34_34]